MDLRRTRNVIVLLLICLQGSTINKAQGYNHRTSSKWPTTGEWLSLLRSLSEPADVFGPFYPEDYEVNCGPEEIDIMNPFVVATSGQGLCMQYPECANKYCLDDDNRFDNLPVHVVDARSESDIIKATEFANRFNIPISVKSSGHSMTGASSSSDSLMIWLANYPKDNMVKQNYSDSCDDGVIHDFVIGINAGQNFADIAEAVQNDYHFVSASEGTVSASGGWVAGNGLSYTSRKYGLGVDNVVDFQVVLPSGVSVTADRCKNSELFWSLRGGGGGTFGTVAHMNYKLHPKTPITRMSFSLGPLVENPKYVRQFFNFWIDQAKLLDNRWGGKFSSTGVDLFFIGYQVALQFDSNAKQFVNAFDVFAKSINDDHGVTILDLPSSTVVEYNGWSDILPLLNEEKEYDTEMSFSRYVTNDIVNNKKEELVNLLVSLSLAKSLGSNNFLVGGAINSVGEEATSVHPVTRNSLFMITMNADGYKESLSLLSNSISGSSKNHHGSLEPNWRDSLWGENYQRLLAYKKMIDPNFLLIPYKSVGYTGQEVDINNRDGFTYTPPSYFNGDSNSATVIITDLSSGSTISTTGMTTILVIFVGVCASLFFL